MAATAEAARPGTTYFAPGVRVRKLGALRSGRDPGEDVPADVLGDVLRVEVTRVNTGLSQWTITLNNWYASTAEDRAKGAGTREVERGARPSWPRYKYNDFELLKFGDRLRIDMRYWPDPVSGLDAATSAAQNWVPMIAGPITDMRFTFSSGEGARITICGEDDLNPLKDRPEEGERIEFDNLSERTIVSRVLAAADYPLRQIAASTIPWPAFAENDAQGLDEALSDGQEYLKYLESLAERLDFEVFVEFADLTDPDSGVAFHFEPARSRRPPDGTLRDILVLGRDQHLLDFTPTIRVADQYAAVKMLGRHPDPDLPELVRETGEASILADELHAAPGDPALRSGPQLRARFFPGRRANVHEEPNHSNLDPPRMKTFAEARLRQKAREFLTITALTIGLPRLRPGNHVEIRGVRPPFDGFYYVTRTVHTYGADGLRTRFDGRRPGMPEPPYQQT